MSKSDVLKWRLMFQMWKIELIYLKWIGIQVGIMEGIIITSLYCSESLLPKAMEEDESILRFMNLLKIRNAGGVKTGF